jgi:hypothetical protein
MKKLIETLTLSAVAVFCSIGSLYAQEDGPGYIQLRFVEVKADSVAEFEAAVSDIKDVYQAAGHPYYHIYQSVRGEIGFVEITMDPYLNEVPQIQLPPSLLNRVTQTLSSMRLVTLAVYPELSTQGSGSVEPSGEFMTVRVRTTSPQNQQAYYDWHAQEFTPALREAGWTDVRMGRVVAGGNINTFVKFTYSDEIPPDNAEIVARMDIENLIAREQELSVTEEDYVDRFRADLSFTAE